MTRTRNTAVLLLLFLLVMYNLNFRAIASGDTYPTRLLPFSLLLRGHLYLDEYMALKQLEWVHRGAGVIPSRGHWVSRYPIALPLLITPVYAVPAYLLRASHLDTPDILDTVSRYLEKGSASLIAAASAALLYLLLTQLCSAGSAVWLTLLYGLATNTWAISSQALWQHGLTELTLVIVLLALFKGRASSGWLWVAGISLGVAVANRPTNLSFAIVSVAYMWRYHRPHVWRAVGPVIILAGLVITYNVHHFGTALGGYTGEPLHRPSGEALAGLLISPSRGLLIYTPFVLFSGWGSFRGWSQRDPLLNYFAFGALGLVGFYTMATWWGGYSFGPRLLTDLSPLWVLLLVPLLPILRERRLLGMVFLLCSLLAGGVQVTGAFFYPSGGWDSAPVSVDLDPQRLWDWRDPALLRDLQAGPAPSEWLFLLRPWEWPKGGLPASARTVAFVRADIPKRFGIRELTNIAVTVQNLGDRGWSRRGDPLGRYAVQLSYRWWDEEEKVMLKEGVRTALPESVNPGTLVGTWVHVLPPDLPGRYILELAMVEQMGSSFESHGPAMFRQPVTVVALPH